MKLTKSKLNQIIREELEKTLTEVVQVGGGVANKPLIAKLNQYNDLLQKVNDEIGKVNDEIVAMAMQGPVDPKTMIAMGEEKKKLELKLPKLMSTITLIQNKMFQGTSGSEVETGASEPWEAKPNLPK